MMQDLDVIRTDAVREVTIHVTQFCNLRCKGCYAHVENEEKAQKLEVSDLEWINENFNPEKTLLLGGEPLAYPYLEDALKIFKHVTLSTNSIYVKDRIDLLKRYKVNLQLCMHPDTYIQLGNGIIEKVKNLHSTSAIIGVDFEKYNLKKANCSNFIKTDAGTLFKIKTRTSSIKVTGEHKFPIINNNGETNDVKANDLRKGDFLLLPKTIPFRGKIQKLPKIKNRYCNTKLVNLPEHTSPDLVRLLGYVLGDGLCTKNRCYVAMFDKSKNTLMKYKKSGEKLFNITSKMKKHKTQNTCILSFYSVPLAQFFSVLGMDKLSKDRTIPKLVHKLPIDQLSYFIAGLYDAEGCISKSEILIASASEDMLIKLQLLLKRFGIISGITMHHRKFGFESGKGYIWYNLHISSPTSIHLFSNDIAPNMFSAEKKKKIIDCIKNKSEKGWIYERYPLQKLLKGIFDDLNISMFDYFGDYNNSTEYRIKKGIFAIEQKIKGKEIPIFQREIARYLETATSNVSYWITGKNYRKNIDRKEERGMTVQLDNYYLKNKKKQLKSISKKILQKKICNAEKKIKLLQKILNCFYFDEIVEIKKILHNSPVYDLSVPKLNNFIANGIVTHNSLEGRAKYNDYIRGKGVYEKVIEAGILAKQEGLKCYFRMGYCENNLRDVDWLLKNVSAKHGIPLVLLPRLDQPPMSIDKQIYLFDLITSAGNDSLVDMPHFFQYLGKRGRCLAGSERLNFNYDRAITPCQFDWNYTIGRIEQPREVINKAREMYIKNCKFIKRECINCSRADICKGGCRMTNAHLGCPLKADFNINSYIEMHGNTDVGSLVDKINRLVSLVKDAEIC